MKKLVAMLLMTVLPMRALVIGSDSAVSRQSKSFFKKVESLSNTMKGFSVFEKGIVLEDADTTVLFDAFFPVSGDVVLNGGNLSLTGDIAFKNPFRIGVGKITGNGYALELPRNISYLDFPSFYYLKLIVNLLSVINVSSQVYSIDWNYNDAYVAVALKGVNGVAELKILSFNGNSFTLVASQDFGTTTLNGVRWHPSSNYLVTAGAAGIELKVWFFNSSNNTISEISNDDVGVATAVQWNHSGSHVAVGRKTSSQLLIYPVTNGVLGTPKVGSFGNSLQVQNNAISWHSSDAYIAVGVQHASNSQDVFVFSFNGTSVSLLSSVNTGYSANALSWIPQTFYLTVGLQTSNESLRMYSFNPSTYAFAEITSARVGLADNVLGMRWSDDGRYLAISKDYSYQNFELEIYYYEFSDDTLHLVSGYSSDGQTRDVSWAHNGQYVVTGDDANNVYVFNFKDAPFVFKNLKLFLRSELRAHASIMIEGTCVINGDGNTLDLSSTASLIIKPNSQLILEDIVIKGINNNILCLDDSSSIVLRDVVWAQDANTSFTVGSLQVKNDVIFRGDAIFSYESVLTSSIMAKSQLILDSGMTFSYNPSNNNNNLLKFMERSATLVLDGADMYVGPMGLQLTTGKFKVNRNSQMRTDGEISFGTGTMSDDIECNIISGIEFLFGNGVLNYKNANRKSWKPNNFSNFRIGSNATLALYTALDIGNGSLQLDQNSKIKPVGSGGLLGRVYSSGEFTYVRVP